VKRSYFFKTGNVTYDFLEETLTPLQGPLVYIYPMCAELVCCTRTYEFVNNNSNFKLSLDINKLEDADDAVVAYFMKLSQHISV